MKARRFIFIICALLFLVLAQGFFLLFPYLHGYFSSVPNASSQYAANIDNTVCSSGGENNILCARQSILNVFDAQGLGSALDKLASLYASNPVLAAECHGFTHDLGKIAYEKFSHGKELKLTPKMSYCGYGFYHGFMETMLHSSGNVEEARKFCARADEAIARGACYHGIGHGVVDGSDPRAWGSAEKIIAPGIKMCKLVAATDDQFYRCATGVFNSLAIMLAGSQNGLVPNSDHPYALCERLQDPRLKKACYEEMNTLVVYHIAQNNFSKAISFISTVPEPVYAEYAMYSLASAAAAVSLQHPNDEDAVVTCQTLAAELRRQCVRGFVGGFVEHGLPGKEYVRALAFCVSNQMSEYDKKNCFERLAPEMRLRYSPQEKMDICNSLGTDTARDFVKSYLSLNCSGSRKIL